MNYPTTYDGHAQSSLPSRQTFPPAPFPRKYVHSVIDDLRQAEQAVHALQAAGYDARDIYLFAGQEFAAAVEHRLQQKNGLSETLLRFFASTDEGFFGDAYLHAARRGHYILIVHPIMHTSSSISAPGRSLISPPALCLRGQRVRTCLTE